MENKLTIFTSTFNRKNNLLNLYESLCSQSSNKFEWYIIDDGSNDKTSEFVNKLKKEGKIKIIFEKHKNIGKYRELLYALKNCKTRFFLCMDDDDKFVQEAIDVLNANTNRLENDSKLIGIVFPVLFKKKIKKTECQAYYKFCEFKEKLSIKETLILFDLKKVNNLKFKIFEKEKFTSEELVYNEIDRLNFCFGLSMDVISDFLGYRDEGLTKNLFINWISSPCSTKELFRTRYKTIYNLNIYQRNIKRYKTIIYQICLSWCLKENIRKNVSNVFLAYLFIPIAYVIYIFYFKRKVN